MSMIGKFVTIPDSTEKDYWHDGEIIEAIGTDRFLVRLRNVVAGPPFSRIFSIAGLTEAFFFENEQELDRFREWSEEPATPKILKFEK